MIGPDGKRFEQFSLAYELVSEDKERQISTLLYCLDKEAKVLGSTNITEEEQKQYSKLLEKFNSHFQV